jgi:hypothetical protein
MNYVVSYDQHRDRDYTPIWNQFSKWGAKRVLESVLFFTSSMTASEIRDQLMAVTRKEDSLVVLELTPSAKWGTYRAQDEGVQWLRTNIAA